MASEYGVLDEDWTCMDLKTSCSLVMESVRSIFEDFVKLFVAAAWRQKNFQKFCPNQF